MCQADYVIIKCSKIPNSFLSLFIKKMLVIRAKIFKIIDNISNSLIKVCPVCQCSFGRQPVFEILEHLPYFYVPYDVASESGLLMVYRFSGNVMTSITTSPT